MRPVIEQNALPTCSILATTFVYTHGPCVHSTSSRRRRHRSSVPRLFPQIDDRISTQRNRQTAYEGSELQRQRRLCPRVRARSRHGEFGKGRKHGERPRRFTHRRAPSSLHLG